MIPITQRRLWQPDTPVPINWGNSLTRGLVYANAGPAARNWVDGMVSTITGTTVRSGQSGRVRGFGSTLGVGTTDSVVTSLRTHADQRTYIVRVLRNGAGGNGVGRIFDKRYVTTQTELLNYTSTGGGLNNIEFTRNFSGGSGTWQFPTGAFGTGREVILAVTYDSSSTSNVPLFYLSEIGGNSISFGVSQTVSTITSPSGTRTDNADPYVLGNRTTDNARVWDGWIGEFLVWDRILSGAEVAEVSSNPWQLFAPREWRIFLGGTNLGAKLRMYDNATAKTSLTGLICLWWDSTDVVNFTAPKGRTGSATTDSNGDLILDLHLISGLTAGQTGYLVVRKEDGSDHRDSLVFQGRVTTENLVGGTALTA